MGYRTANTGPHQNRRALNAFHQVVPELVNWSAHASGSHTVTLTFDEAVQLSGKPSIIASGGAVLSTATQTSPTHIELDFSGSIATGATLTLATYDKSIRTNAGGYALSGQETVT